MKSIIHILLIISIAICSNNNDSKKNKKKYAENAHQFIVYQSYGLLKYQMGEANNIKQHIGTLNPYTASGYQSQK